MKHWKAAVYGDSISHGGGHLSFGPADLAYSYESYLDFPSINLSQSGDTSEAMVMRFEKDVLPFRRTTCSSWAGRTAFAPVSRQRM